MMIRQTVYRLEKNTVAQMDERLDAEVLAALWNGFCYRVGELTPKVGERNRIAIGEARFLPLGDNEEYTVSVTERGIGILARDAASLVRGFCALLIRLEMREKDALCVPCAEIRSAFTVARRMIHLCIFPETDLSMLKRLVRLCGVLSYTHVVLEFWGTLRYDCLRELAWDHAFSKEEIAPIIREARALGMEPIPMINHLGHAASCRIDTGKHVVLDQNPSLQYLFTPDGWCWNIFSDEARALLKRMRNELYELFGAGEYFHVGCDEAHIFSSNYYPETGISDYLSALTREVAAEGRRPILWGDMILPYDCNSDKPEKYTAAWERSRATRKLLDALAPDSVIADWHYDTKKVPVETVLEYQKAGFAVLGCPWDTLANIDAHYATAREHDSYGLMMTTWHTLHANLSAILYFARKCGFPKTDWSDASGHRNLEIATLLRRVSPTPLSYAETGFAHRQIKEVIDW